MIYLTGASNNVIRENARRWGLGLMLQPGSGYIGHGYDYARVAADNGCFSLGEQFNGAGYMRWLESIPYRESLLFAVAPDAVCDAEATTALSMQYMRSMRDIGVKVAYVGQNGLTVDSCPWDEFDTLFLGGDTAWKLGAFDLVWEARKRRKRVHMGRVNSKKRLLHAQIMGCDSADGTFLKFGPNVNIVRLLAWIEDIRTQPVLWERTR